MKRLLGLLLVMVFVFGFSFLSYSKVFKIGLVYDVGGRGDKSFNDMAAAGLDRAKEELGIIAIELEPAEGGVDREELLRKLAAAHCDLVIGVGFLFTDAIRAVAEEYPDVKFAIVDGYIPDMDNVASLLFAEHQGSFLVGAIAGLFAKKKGAKIIGFVGGMECPLIQKFEVGYRAGAKLVYPDVKVLVNYIGVTGEAFKDPVRGRELALAQFGKGALVVYHASGASGEGVIRAAQETGRYAIGVDANQNWMAPGHVLTSMLKRVDVAVYSAIKSVIDGTYHGGVWIFDLKNNGVGYALDKYNKDLVTEDMVKVVEDLKQKVIRGEITVPQTREELKAFWKKYGLPSDEL